MKRPRISAALSALALCTLTACGFNDVRETIHRTLPASAMKLLHVNNAVGGVTVRAWDKPQVDIVAEKSARSVADLGNISIEVQTKGAQTTISTVNKGGGGFWHGGGIGYTILVPANISLDVNNDTGGVRVYGLNGDITARVGTGGVEGDLGRVTGNRKIDMQVGTGGIDIKMARASDATFDLHTSVGGVHSDFAEDRVGSGSAKVRLHTGTGGVELHAT
jgi:hypothetical protein